MSDDGKRRLAMRNRGFFDGRAGRPAASPDADYQRSWRRGLEARNDDSRGATVRLGGKEGSR
jgi:hypothetical protein